MTLDWRYEGDMCRIKIGTCCVKQASKHYSELLQRHKGSGTETSELEFWNGYYNLK